jgi:hypothetical protein
LVDWLVRFQEANTQGFYDKEMFVVKQQAFVFGSDRWRIFVVKQLTVGSTW